MAGAMTRTALLLVTLCACAAAEHVREFAVRENARAATLVGHLGDELPDASPPYTIVPVPGSAVNDDLRIDAHTGEIRTKAPLDRENRDHYALVAIPASGDNIRVVVRVLDENDNAPTFPTPVMNVDFSENTPRDVKRKLNPARDQDLGAFNTQRYNIVSGNTDNAFRLSSHRERDGVLYLDLQINGFLDRETTDHYELVIEALDGGTPPLRGTMMVNITILDVNDNPPVFAESVYSSTIAENATVGTPVLRVSATDADSSENGLIEYSINRRQSDKENMFRIDPETGEITVNKALDFETRELHELVIVARDKGAQPLETTAFVTIRVTDVNDNQPTIDVIFLSDDATPKISESAQLDEFVARISVHDPDSKTEYANVNVTLSGGDGHFDLRTHDNIIYLVVVALPLDREAQSSYTLNVVATDKGSPPLHASRIISLRVTDVNDNTPVFSEPEYKASVPEAASPGTPVVQVTALDADEGENADIRYSLLASAQSEWFSIDERSGLVTTRSRVECETNPSPRLTVVARDRGNPPLSATASLVVTVLDINDNEPIFDQSFYNVTVPENEAVGSCILKVLLPLESTTPQFAPATSNHTGTEPASNLAIWNTHFGHVILGKVPHINSEEVVSLFCTECETDVNEIVTKFWQTEKVPEVYPEHSSESETCEQIFKETVLLKDKKFEVSLPLKLPLDSVNAAIGDSLSLALKRFYNLETRLHKDAVLYKLYKDFIDEYLALGHGKVVEVSEYDLQKDPVYFLPHHPVVRMERKTTKCRVVFDGSMKGSNKVSLNNLLLNGPVVQNDLFDILLLFRLSESTLISDVKQMFRAISLCPTQRSLLNILWRDTPNDRVQCIQLQTVTYGLKTSSYLATRCLLELAEMYEREYPKAAFALKHQTYVDDILVSDTKENLIEIKKQLCKLLERGGFQLHKWTSNAPDILDDVPSQLKHFDEIDLQKDSTCVKTLGINYNVKDDNFILSSPSSTERVPQTKRQILSHISKFFDPLGLAGPIVIGAKVIMQKLWKDQLDWDACPNQELKDIWLEFYNSLTSMTPIVISRHATTQKVKYAQLIGFCDASSSTAYGCCIYLRTVSENGDVRLTLLCSKSRVNPINKASKKMTVPRLELNSALLLANLITGVHKNITLKMKCDNVILYSDSQIVLAWIATNPIKLNPYVGNRVGQILQLTNNFIWSYVPSELNPADIISRGVLPHEIEHCQLWWKAPEFLHDREYQIPQYKPLEIEDLPEVKKVTTPFSVLTCSVSDEKAPSLDFLDKFSDINKRQRVLAYVVRFCNNARKKTPQIRHDFLMKNELDESLSLIIKSEQHRILGKEIDLLKKDKDLGKSNLKPLYPFIDEKGLVRVGGRLHNADISYSQRHPVILPKGSVVTDLIIRSEHIKNFHAGPKLVLASINQRFWIVHAVREIKKVLHKCVVCFRLKKAVSEQLMGSLPSDRVRAARPFQKMSAIDPDCGVNAIVNYTLSDLPGRQEFSISPESGDLCVAAPLDHETGAEFEFPVIATDRGGLSTTAMVKIQLVDINDNVPAFTTKDSNITLKEGRISSAEPIVAVSAIDADGGRFGTVTYRIVNGNDNDVFRIDRSTGEIFVTKPALIQANSKFDLEISATDGGGLSAPQSAMVHVNVMPAGVGSVFDKPRYNFRVREDIRTGTVIGNLKPTGNDRGKPLVRYSLVSGDTERNFFIEPTSGTIRLSSQLDRELKASYLLNVLATSGSPQSHDQTQVSIIVEDINDNAPEFGPSSVRVSVAESVTIGSVLYAARATDLDEGKNGQVTYALVSATGPPNTFAVNPHIGTVTVLRSLDYENLVRHTLIISAKDSGNPPLSANLTLVVDVQDVNDNPPVFEHDSYVANVLESEAINTKIQEIQAIDKDTGNNARITYRITSENGNDEFFGIQSNTGWIFLAKQLDRETTSSHRMTITAMDNGLPPLSATAQLVINVIDANDNDPVFYKESYEFQVEENREAGSIVGSITASDADLDENAALRYSLFPSNTSFNVNPVTGIITTKERLDREFRSSYSVFAEAKDQGSPQRSSRVPVIIKVTDVNDNSPEIIDPREDVVSVREEQQPGAEVARVKAMDRDNGVNSSVTYSILNERDSDGFGVFVIDSKTGVIKTSTVLDHEERSIYRLTVAAKDGGKPPRQTVRQLKVEVLDLNDNRPTFTSSTLSFKVKENAKIGHIVGTLACCESQIQDNLVNGDLEKHISYLLLPLTVDHLPGTFEIDRRTGSLVVARQLDREIQDEYRLEVRALDTSATNNPQSSAVTVKIEIVDINDNSPQWDLDPIKINISENTAVGMIVYNFTAHDKDSGNNGEINFQIVSSMPSTAKVFALDPLTGYLTLTSNLDYEMLKEYWLIIRATDLAVNATERLSTAATVHVNVLDANDNAPKFVSASKATVSLNTLSGTLYEALAVDADSGENGRISYYISSGNNQGYFHIDYDTGKLSISKKFSAGKVQPGHYKLNLTAADHGTPYPKQTHLALLFNLLESTNIPPRFTEPFHKVNISEDIKPGSFVARVLAKSSRGDNGNLTYTIPVGIANNKFTIDERRGTITAVGKIDREEKDYYVFKVYVTDFSSYQSTNFDVTTVTINVLDVNDNPPVFKPGSCYALSVPENNDVQVIHTVSATDKDIGRNGVITYGIVSGNNGNKFQIDPTSGQLTAKTLDRETQSKYYLTITAFDHGSPIALQGSCNITILVEDQNDNDPVFDTGHYSAMIPEDAQIFTSVIRVRATDADLGLNKKIVYSLANESQGLFRIDNVTGVIFTTGLFDREKRNIYNFEAVATDEGRYVACSQKVTVEVSINDVNDNKPIFSKYPFKEQVATLTPPGQSLLKVSATDIDIGTNGEVLYELLDTSNHKFRINPTTGVLTATQSLASENGKLIHLKVLAKDKGNPAQSSVGLIEIRVGDFSENTPTLNFQNATYNVTVPENYPNGRDVIQVTAVRSDGRLQPIIYEFGNGNDQYAFEIDSNSGAIRVNNSANLDYESYPGPRRKLVVVARTDGSPVLYGYSEVAINLLDQNDNPPRFTQQQYTANVFEGITKGEFVVQLSAKDGDQGANARILYHIVDGNHDNAFIIEPAFSGSVKTNIVLDREIRETYKLTVIATDEGDPQMTGTATLRINVVDVNDNQPTFPPPNVISVSEGTEVGTVLTSVTANDVDTYPALKYMITQDESKDTHDPSASIFSIDLYSGKVVLNKPLDFETKQLYQVNVTVSDSLHLAKTALTIKVTDVNDNTPVFDEISYDRVLPEGAGTQEIGTVSAKDKDSGDNGRISFSFLRPTKGYYIDPTSGVIFVNYSALLDIYRDTQLAVVATDHGKPNRSSVAAVRISAEASSEIKPFIGQDTYRITVNEDAEKGTSLLQIGGINDIVKKYNLEFHIVSGNEGDAFEVSLEGALILVKKVDRETQDAYVLGLAALEQGKMMSYSQNKTSITIFVTVADANDNAPVFSSNDFELTVSEDVNIGHTLIQMSATDADLFGTSNSVIDYNITSGDDQGLFYINTRTGVITVNKTLDYDMGYANHKLIIVACDQGVPSLCNYVFIKLAIIDENDNAPTFPVTEYFETIPENERVGTSVFTARATDLDRGRYGKLNYSIIPAIYNRIDDSWKMFQIDSGSGLVNTNAIFDYEQKNKYEFTIKAIDLGGKSSTVKVRIDVESRDEFYPQFTQKTYNFEIPKSGSLRAGYPVGHVTATDRDKGIDGRIAFQLSTSHSYFKINRTSGEIILKKRVDDINQLFGSDKSISLVVTASSGRQGSLTNKTAVEITPNDFAHSQADDNVAAAANGGLSDWALGLLIAFIFIIIIFAAAFLFLHMKNKRHKKVNKPGLSSEGVGATNSYVDPGAFDTIPIRNTGAVGQFAPPKYDEIPPYGPHTASSNSAAATTSELSGSDQSGSSGRGSAEDGEDGEDEEIRMINEGPLQRDSLHRANGVDDDNLSDVSVHNTQEYLARLGIVDTGTGGGASTSSRRCSENVVNKDPLLHHSNMDPMHMFDEDAAHENDITNLIYAKLNEVTGSDRASSADETSAAVDRAMALGAFPSAPGDNTAVPTAGPSMTGSLSSIVHSEEELTGSYNWDYLLDWGPQYQPLAHVFSEIARLKDDAVSLQSGNSGASSAKSKGTSMSGGKNVPPPLLTTVAPRSCPVPSLACRQPQHLLPRSPISHDVPGGFSAAAAMSPSFSPSLSPLATRSPSMSPLVGPGLPTPANRKTHSTLRL